jgi:hypothetical protein
MRVFLSHISDEASEARALKKALEQAIPGSEVFVSAADIHLGNEWLKEIDDALTSSKAILALCSPNSVRRPWLNFETGSGWTRRIPVIPICHKGMRKDRLPDPLRIFQSLEIGDTASCKELVTRLGKLLGLLPAKDFDTLQMIQSIKLELPQRTSEVGIVLCHGQDEWAGGERSVINLITTRANELKNDWSLRALSDERDFLSVDFHKLSGLIFASPRRAHIEPETIAATVEWVKMGGRLLLLGFELGDRHHEANLEELSHHFGIDLAADIVGPAGYKRKPYGLPIKLDTAIGDAHPFTEGLTTIQLANLQTVRVDPGGVEWLRVGCNSVYRPSLNSVVHRNGIMTTPAGAEFQENENASWLPVAVEAPKGLCGDGSVQMIGTWDLIGRSEPFVGDNFTMVNRLLDWLSQKTA